MERLLAVKRKPKKRAKDPTTGFSVPLVRQPMDLRPVSRRWPKEEMIRKAKQSDIPAIRAIMKAEPGFWQESWRTDVLERGLKAATTWRSFLSKTRKSSGSFAATILDFVRISANWWSPKRTEPKESANNLCLTWSRRLHYAVATS